jgi:hypothetical protein
MRCRGHLWHDAQDRAAGHGTRRDGRRPAPGAGGAGADNDEVTDLVAQRVRKSEGRTSARRLLPIAVAAE